MHSKFILFSIALAAIFAFSAAAEEDDDEDTGARDTMRLDMSKQPDLTPVFPYRLDRRPLTVEAERIPQEEPLGRNYHDRLNPSWFDNETLDLPFKEDNSDLPLITPKIHINW